MFRLKKYFRKFEKRLKNTLVRHIAETGNIEKERCFERVIEYSRKFNRNLAAEMSKIDFCESHVTFWIVHQQTNESPGVAQRVNRLAVGMSNIDVSR